MPINNLFLNELIILKMDGWMMDGWIHFVQCPKTFKIVNRQQELTSDWLLDTVTMKLPENKSTAKASCLFGPTTDFNGLCRQYAKELLNDSVCVGIVKNIFWN